MRLDLTESRIEDGSSPGLMQQIYETSEIGAGNIADTQINREAPKLVNQLNLNPKFQNTLAQLTTSKEEFRKLNESSFQLEPESTRRKTRYDVVLERVRYPGFFEVGLDVNYHTEEFNPKKFMIFESQEFFLGIHQNNFTAGLN